MEASSTLSTPHVGTSRSVAALLVAALLSRRRRHGSSQLSLRDRAESSLVESAAWAIDQKSRLAIGLAGDIGRQRGLL
jgi:MYXO-CTERM domain-containing protein